MPKLTEAELSITCTTAIFVRPFTANTPDATYAWVELEHKVLPKLSFSATPEELYRLGNFLTAQAVLLGAFGHIEDERSVESA